MSSTLTAIEWTDATWDPMTGCTKISSGCDNCYALAASLTKTRDVYLRRLPVRDTDENRANPFAPGFWDERLDQPPRWKTPMRFFVNSMSGVFHSHFSLDMIRRVFDVTNRAHWHQFQLLTKRPERALRYADRFTWTSNIWIGTSIENMAVAKRANALRAIQPVSVRFISAEPLLCDLGKLDLTDIDWSSEAARAAQTIDRSTSIGLVVFATIARTRKFHFYGGSGVDAPRNLVVENWKVAIGTSTPRHTLPHYGSRLDEPI